MAISIKDVTSAYIDDIFANEALVSAALVSDHLSNYRLSCKVQVRLKDRTKVLGLQVWGVVEKGYLQWKRGSKYLDLPKDIIYQAAFSLCEQLLGHFSVCGWLRIATNIK